MDLSSTAKPVLFCRFLFLGSMDDKSFHMREHTHPHAKLLCDIRLEARVSHANETDPASSRQHANVLHSGASLGKLKSFSPPSPVTVTVMEGRWAIILPSTHCKIQKPFPWDFFLLRFSSPWINKISLKYAISNTVVVNSLPHIYWRKTDLQGHWVLFNSDEGCDPSVSIGCAVQGCHCDLDSASPRSLSYL